MPGIVVEIIGNASQYKKELESAVAATNKANTGFAKMSKAAGIAGLAIAGGLAIGLDKSVKAAMAAQEATARLDQAFRQSHISARAYSGAIDDAEASGRKLGFSNIETKNALGSLVIATHSAKKAISELSVADDIARFKHTSLEAATKMLTMAQAGSQRAIKQLGLTMPTVTSRVDALRAAHKKLDDQTKGSIPPIDAMAMATARAADKQETAARVIDLVKQKLSGQADAYSKTAAGGMAQFHAQVENLEEKLGAGLLPALTVVAGALASVAGYLSEHTTLAKVLVGALAGLAAVLLTVSIATKVWAAAQLILNVALSANPIGIVIVAIAALAAGIIYAYTHSATFRRIVQETFAAIKAAAAAVAAYFTGTLVPAFKSAWEKGSAAVLAAWRIIQPIFSAIVQVVRGMVNIIIGIFTGDWARAWNGFKTVAMGAWNLFKAWLAAVPGEMLRLAAAIGAALVNGIRAGIESLWSSFIGWLSAKVHDIPGIFKRFLGIASPSTVFHEIGVNVIDGFIEGLNAKDFKSTMVTKINDAIQAAKTAVDNARGTLGTAFGNLVSEVNSALDKIGQTPTKAEAALTKLQAAHDAAARKRALSDARAQQAAAQAALAALTPNEGEDPAAFAGRMASAQDAVKAATQQVEDAKYAIQVASLEKQAAAQRAARDQQTQLNQMHADKQLAAAESAYLKGRISFQQYHQRLLDIMREYHIPMKKGAALLGAALEEGLNDAMKGVTAAAKALANTIIDQLSKIRVIVNVDLQVKNPPSPSHRAGGGPVTAGMPYIVGERGPELFMPGQSGTIIPNRSGSSSGIGSTVNVYVSGSVISERDLVTSVRDGLLQLQRRTGSLGFS